MKNINFILMAWVVYSTWSSSSFEEKLNSLPKETIKDARIFSNRTNTLTYYTLIYDDGK